MQGRSPPAEIYLDTSVLMAGAIGGAPHAQAAHDFCNALVVADDLDIAPEALAPYLDYVRKPGNGYVSVEMPLGDRIELSMRT